MTYGKIHIATTNWQTNADITQYESGIAFFKLFGDNCKCDITDKVLYHEVNGKWEPFDAAGRVTDIHTPEISTKTVK